MKLSKILALLLALCMVLGLAACGGQPAQPAADDAVARTEYAAGRGKWSGKRFHGRVTLFPDIRSTYMDMEVTENGLVLLIGTDWLPAVNDGKPFKAVRV